MLGYHFCKTQIQAKLSNISFRDACICDKTKYKKGRRMLNIKGKII